MLAVVMAQIPFVWWQGLGRRWPVVLPVAVSLAVLAAGLMLRRPGWRGRETSAAPLPPDRPLRPLSWQLLPVAALLIAGVTGLAVVWLQHVVPGSGDRVQRAQLRVESIRTGLTIGAGVTGALALLLAFRRQQLAERTQQATEYDAGEKRVTELYVKAADQLGSEKAPVRLAGLYALERLAQDNPTHRQSIVEVICAYLRMPYTLPGTESAPDTAVQQLLAGEQESTNPGSVGGTQTEEPQQNPWEEREVRLAAQRILARHLRVKTQEGEADPNYWGNKVVLDLTGALLIDANFASCHLHNAIFSAAIFSGDARFDDATFSGDARFNKSTFSRDARFGVAKFGGDVRFDKAVFGRDARFNKVEFGGGVLFDKARFSHGTRFSEAIFSGDSRFRNVAFGREVWFDEVSFGCEVRFDRATFNGEARFNKASFVRDAHFSRVRFGREAGFDQATFSSNAWFGKARFSVAWFSQVVFNGDAWFSGAVFDDTGWFGEARFNGEAAFSRVMFGAGGWFNEAIFNGEAAFGGATFDRDSWFDDVTFNDTAWFSLALFKGDAGYSRTMFNGVGWFDAATFNGEARFRASVFSGDAWFGRAAFNGDTDFEMAEFNGKRRFDGSNIGGLKYGGSSDYAE
ncbi:pentapeptide repeat-containing protein [Micromonospora sp. WMMD712]|uniref:pentapeptide repeat-containing protein n=1 Tax=Micromonospora TaxID=1873 RepID=UPI00249B463B|nr:pentapeptide repeat-containing protein [Micromonospora sp. WMMD712]WFE58416.1 pentapeptide repeat-containing protein [Micromonospora sp. WMMD712]